MQNRNLVAKGLFHALGTLKNTAAYYRGVADGFWLGLKSDWQGLQDPGTAVGSAISFVFVEDDEGRMARAVAIYNQVKEIKDAFAGVKAREVPAIIGKMASTMMRDLYTDSEAALGWEPITTGIDPMVINYMAGVATGFVGEQIVVGLIPIGGQVARITATLVPVIRGVVTAVKTSTRYVMPALEAGSKATMKTFRHIERALGRTREEVLAVLHGARKSKATQLPSGRVPTKVLDDWFSSKPQLWEDILGDWAEWMPNPVSDVHVEHLIQNFARVLDTIPNGSLNDDALRGWARFYGALNANVSQSAAYTQHLIEVMGGRSSFDRLGFESVMKQIRGTHPSYNVALVSGRVDSFRSTSGVIYGADDVYGNRITHLLRHSRTADPSKSLFRFTHDQLLGLIDQAYNMRSSAVRRFNQGGNRVRYEILMDPDPNGPGIGTAGQRYLALVIEDGGKFITAFPLAQHTSTPSNF